jgi:hypothetical protein
MAKLDFRALKADEVECRVATCSEKGVSLLLYKDARCDMNILDETVGAFNWQRHHGRDNANCVVAIFDELKGQWIEKEDTGTESNTEAAKGLASDSFKRACFNWGIGRELYTAPFIWIPATACNVKPRNDGKYQCYDKFTVKELHVDDKKRITGVSIYNATTKAICYTWGKAKNTVQLSARDEFREFCKSNNLSKQTINKVIRDCNLSDNSPETEWVAALIYAQSLIAG